MSTIGIVALTLVALWAGALTLITLLLVRQVSLVTLRLDRAEDRPALDGISVGSAVPEPVSELLGERNGAVGHVLVLGATCAPCRQLADELHDTEASDPILSLIGGDVQAAQAIARRLPAWIEPVLDPEASTAIDSLDLQTTPFLFTVQAGRIVGKDVMRNAAHFIEYTGLQADGSAPGAPQPLEVTHVY